MDSVVESLPLQFLTAKWATTLLGLTIKGSLVLVLVGLACTALRTRSAFICSVSGIPGHAGINT